MIFTLVTLVLALMPHSSLALDGSLLKEALEKSSYKKMKPLQKKDFDEDVVRLFRHIENSSPEKITGDFNGDEKEDLVLLVRSSKEVFALLAIQDKKNISLIKVDSWEINPKSNLEDTYLSLLPQNKANFEGKKITKKRDLIQIETYLGSVKAFFYHDGKIYPYKGNIP